LRQKTGLGVVAINEHGYFSAGNFFISHKFIIPFARRIFQRDWGLSMV
jgi:hypothetical protein